jgi:hypothetical protein
MNLHKIVYISLISVIMTLSNANAMPAQAVLNTTSPLINQYAEMGKIYLGSCLTSNATSGVMMQNMPMYENDILVNRFRKQYPDVSNFTTHTLVFAGFELGRALYITDLSKDYKNNLCLRYAMNFAGVIVNNAATTKGSSTDSPPPPRSATPASLNLDNVPNPFNDILAPKEIPTVNVTSRVSQQSACVYMYNTLAKKPVIEIDALDATLDMIQDMLYNNFKHSDIREAYPNLLVGAKQGRLLFVLQQPIRLCYD